MTPTLVAMEEALILLGEMGQPLKVEMVDMVEV
jgi:hypothetical protein